MKYIATIFLPTGSRSQEFSSITLAAEWLDSENNNLENTTMIETYDENGRKKDGYFYTVKNDERG